MLRLYREILKHHQRHLPEQMRQLGNETVRHEWKQHKTADAAFVTQFHREWDRYLTMMRVQASTAGSTGKIGRDLDDEQLRLLNEEQRTQLMQLREAALKRKQTDE
jgi:hypothetical protein